MDDKKNSEELFGIRNPEDQKPFEANVGQILKDNGSELFLNGYTAIPMHRQSADWWNRVE